MCCRAAPCPGAQKQAGVVSVSDCLTLHRRAPGEGRRALPKHSASASLVLANRSIKTSSGRPPRKIKGSSPPRCQCLNPFPRRLRGSVLFRDRELQRCSFYGSVPALRLQNLKLRFSILLRLCCSDNFDSIWVIDS